MAEDGNKRIAAAVMTNFDIAFIDMKMPDIDGIETFKEIKKVDPATNVIMETDQDIEDFTDQTASRGAFAHIIKPVNLAMLLQLTINAIEKNKK